MPHKQEQSRHLLTLHEQSGPFSWRGQESRGTGAGKFVCPTAILEFGQPGLVRLLAHEEYRNLSNFHITLSVQFALGLGNGCIYEFDTDSVGNEPKKNLNQRLDLARLPIVFLAYDPETTVLLASSLIKMVAFYKGTAYPLLSKDSSGMICF